MSADHAAHHRSQQRSNKHRNKRRSTSQHTTASSGIETPSSFQVVSVSALPTSAADAAPQHSQLPTHTNRRPNNDKKEKKKKKKKAPSFDFDFAQAAHEAKIAAMNACKSLVHNSHECVQETPSQPVQTRAGHLLSAAVHHRSQSAQVGCNEAGSGDGQRRSPASGMPCNGGHGDCTCTRFADASATSRPKGSHSASSTSVHLYTAQQDSQPMRIVLCMQICRSLGHWTDVQDIHIQHPSAATLPSFVQISVGFVAAMRILSLLRTSLPLQRMTQAVAFPHYMLLPTVSSMHMTPAVQQWQKQARTSSRS